MTHGLRRLRGALGLGLTWAVAWAPLGVLLGTIVDPDESMDEMWVAVLGYPGFLSGAVFSVLLWMAEGRRGFAGVSVSRAGAWGAVAGLLVGVLPFLVGTPTARLPPWLLAAGIIGPITLLSALSGAGSLALARTADGRAPWRAWIVRLWALGPSDLEQRHLPVARGR